MGSIYVFQDYIHDYSIWTAARAVQRNFTNTAKIKEAIDKSGLRQFSEARKCNSIEEFSEFHRLCAKQIIVALKVIGVPNATYGRAAKIISIYLKTSVVIPMSGQGDICQLIHPPIDRILLTNLSRKHHLKKLCEKGWTSLNEDEYWSLYERIKKEGFQFNWTLEKYWHPEQERIDEES